MIIFINDNRRNSEFKFKKKKGEGMQMTIPSGVSLDEYQFKFDCIESIKGVYGDIEIHGYDINKDGNTFICKKMKNYINDNETETVFAVLNSCGIALGDILVPENMKKRIKICEVIETSSIDKSKENFINKKYIVSFEVSKDEIFTLYKGYKNSKALREEINFIWDNSTKQFCCKVSKPKKPHAKNLISISDIKI